MKSHDAFLDWINAEFGMRLHELIAYTQEMIAKMCYNK